MYKVAIIEDEPNSQKLLKLMIKNYAPDLELVGIAGEVHQGIALITETSPDLIFLDIEIHGGNGFDILDALPNYSAKVIFVTGYDHYAIKAIRYSALDYLLKPIDVQEFKSAIERIGTDAHSQKKKLNFLKEQMNLPEAKPDKIILSGNGTYKVLEIDKILYLEADGAYVIIHSEDGNHFIAPQNLSYYEEILPVELFFRLHKSCIVHLKKVKSYEQGRGGKAFLKNGVSLPIAFRRKAVFVKLLGTI